MSSRRGPLTSNPNVANSPLRPAGATSLAATYAKQKRSHATMQREEPYGQHPPSKKQAVESSLAQRLARSPSKLPRSQVLVQRGVSAASTTRAVTKERPSKPSTVVKPTNQDDNHDKEVWKKHYRAKFPKMVFYFESIPDDVRAKLTKRVTYLGARQEPFFSIDVTHVITTRSIPSERPETQQAAEPEPEEREPEEQPQTINPSLLDRNNAARRKLLFEFRNVPSRPQQVNDPTKPNKGTRNNDVLHKAREMGKKIWSLDKFQTMVSVLLESESQNSHSVKTTSRAQGQARGGHDNNLLQLLQHERINGPTDRDISASNRELTYFKGPHIYVFDMEERHKPMMVREYAKVANKADGDWPQFRSVGNGRCPFVEEDPQEREYRKLREQREQRQQREQEKARAAAAKQESVPVSRNQDASAKPVTGKRTLAEMEDGHNKVRAPVASVLNPAKAALSKQTLQNAFTSRAQGGRVFHGEPVASGVQPSNVTSAIRSQMISSQAGVSAIKAGTSKELYGLQRKVLQKTAPASHETSTRRPVDQSVEGTSSRPMTLSRETSRTGQPQEEGVQKAAESKEKRSQSQPMKSKKDMKPGYCENCQDKFRDFDEHIMSRKHRRFAENTDNWGDLDSLLSKLKRLPKDFYMDENYDL